MGYLVQPHYHLWRTLSLIASGEHIENLWYLYCVSDDSRSYHTPEAIKAKYNRRIADAYREGCKALWKTYIPILPHDREDPNKNDVRVSLGLLGIQYDLEDGLDFSTLNHENALLATRYAIEELNNFPVWLTELARAHPQAVRDILLECIVNDWLLEGLDKRGSGVGYKLYQQSLSFWQLMEKDLLQLLTTVNPGSPDLLLSMIGVVLRANRGARPKVVFAARDRLVEYGTTALHTAHWFIIWLWLDSDNALSWLEEFSANQPQAEVDSLIIDVGNILHRDNLHLSPTDGEPAYHEPSALGRLVILLYRHIRPKEDIDRSGTGTYSPGPRDNAQDFRNAIVSQLSKIKGIEAHDILLKLADTPEVVSHRQYLLREITSRRLLEAEPDVWKPGDAVEFALAHDPTPHSAHDLYAITLRRLALLKDYLGDADFRKREGLPTDENEDHLQEWLAYYIDQKSQGKYATLREVMVGFGKMPDIRLEAPPHTPTSVEVKWADDWSHRELFEALTDQLVGKYMRARRSRHGVLLLCWRGKKHWRPKGGKGVTFTELVENMNKQVQEILDERWDIDGLIVVGLNFSGGPYHH